VIRPVHRLLPALCAVFALALTPHALAQDSRAWLTLMGQGLDALNTNSYPTAEAIYREAVRETESFRPNDPRRGSTLNSLGLVLRAEKKYTEAEAVFRRALPIMQVAYGDGLDAAHVNLNLADTLYAEGRPAEALTNLRAALTTYRRLLPPNSPTIASALCLEGDSDRVLKQYTEAEALLRRCSDMREANAGIDSDEFADAQYALAQTFIAEGKYADAESHLRLVEKIREKNQGITSPVLADAIEQHVIVLKHLGRDKEAAKLSAIAVAIRGMQNK
jgi:tetratricopeptide (TPR) repeat protein